MADLEGMVGALSSAEAKVESGLMTPEQQAKLIDAAGKKAAEAARSNPESPAVQLSAARVSIAAGKLDDARRYAAKAAELAPEDPWPVVNRGIAEYESCDFPAASRSAREALRRDPGNQNARAMWSLSQRPAGCSNVADKLQSRFVGGMLLEASAPGRVPSAEGLAGGGAFDARGANEVAGAPAAVSGALGQRYTREGFRRFQSLMNRAQTAMHSHEDARAFDLATAAILAFPENPAALFIRGVAGMNLKRLDTVATDATWGMKLDPANKARWLSMRSTAEAVSGRFDAALADARAAVRLEPNAADAWLASAKAKESLSHPVDEWVAEYKRAAELNPAFGSSYQDALARAQARVAAQRQGTAELKADAGTPPDSRLAVLAGVAAGGLLLAWSAIRFVRGKDRRDGEA